MLCLGKSRHSVHSSSLFSPVPLPTSLAEKRSRVWSSLCFAIQGLSTCPYDPRSCCHVITIVRPDFSLKWIRSKAFQRKTRSPVIRQSFWMHPSPTSAMMGLGMIFNVDKPNVGWSLRAWGGLKENGFLSVSCLVIERLSMFYLIISNNCQSNLSLLALVVSGVLVVTQTCGSVIL